jgi:ABC-type transport system substrate-binding protein
MTALARAVFATLLLVLAACSGSAAGTLAPSGGSGQPSADAASPQASAAAQPSSETSSNPAAGPVTTPEEAAEEVMILDPRFAGLGPKDSNLIGACCFYEATTTADGFQVNIELGWGDCPAGCINRHRWVYAVGRDGTTTLLSETGDPVPSGFPGGGSTY